METTALLTADYLDILFDNRNKLYGGYPLRKNYRQRIVKALSGVISMLVIVSSYFYLTAPKQNVVVPKYEMPTILQYIKPELVVPPPISVVPPSPSAAPTENASVDYSNPEIVADREPAENELASVDDIEGKQIGPENAEGNSTDADISVVANDTSGTEMTWVRVAVSPKVERWVEHMPEFEGNLNQYLDKKLKYPELARETNTKGRVTVEFIVNEDGSVSNPRIIKGIGAGCDDEALRVVRLMPKWRPGTQNGKPVKVYLILPINFQLL